ncbi:hypothetical protein [Lutibacter sp.]|uniref:hypothetical protein n=1 Tax=Lutibacter sp. TaxID=1925666 RepID=UPI003565E931
MNKKNLVPRIISMPFIMCILIIPMLILYYKWLKNYFLYGGEVIAYEDIEEKGTIRELYHLLKDQSKH